MPMSQPPIPQSEQEVPNAAPPVYPDVEAMKARARELAIQQYLASKATPTEFIQSSPPMEQPRIIYLRRNLTVAELIIVFAISCGIVYGIPSVVKFVADKLPQIEVKVK